MHESMTPPMASRSRSSSSASFDESYFESYFSKTYVPLSNLPTPPLSSHSNPSSRQRSPENFLSVGEVLDPNLLGPATHLTNLIPSSTSLTSASVPLVHVMLMRANLPLETVALAVCILDSLNSRFALSWRQGCPLITPRPLVWFGQSEEREQKQHIDSIHPELIVLAAVILAVKFLDDGYQATKECASDWGKGLWSCSQINFTQRCILENLGYRLLPLWEESIIIEALEDMKRAGRQNSPELRSDDDWDTDTCFGSFGCGVDGRGQAMSDGRAVLGIGEQVTPAETPAENIRGTKDLALETKNAFQQESGSAGVQSRPFLLPSRVKDSEEPFPVYDDPWLVE
ncbi:hypothetical protein G7Y89_g1505 [Cudoniella acicularis]|uniref:Cyclin N-terminal domain-containing protein n=1 Tax=Cudoniella acicularis TaxID=354080 RepID=A0A8H4RVY1_9HELO|nr:hypothetical protein G7Y89_g1505 [Cudoniella acicularis]